MYIGGTDETALHHLAAEILDNAMDEAVAGHASFIEVSLEAGDCLTVRDNGRGIPGRSASEIQESQRVAGHSYHAPFGRQVRRQGLCDIGRSARRRQFGGQRAVRGDGGRGRAGPHAVEAEISPEASRSTKLINAGPVHNRRGTSIRFRPDPRDFRPTRGSAGAAVPALPVQGLFVSRRGDSLVLRCRRLLKGIKDDIPAEAVLHFPGGLRDSLEADIGEAPRVLPQIWSGEADLPGEATGKVEWAVGWLDEGERVSAFLLQHGPDAARRHP